MSGKPKAVNPLITALVEFCENPKDREPDVKALATLLRGNHKLPASILRWSFAELLDSQLPGNLANNWCLRAHFTGRRDKEVASERITRTIDRKVYEAERRFESVTPAAPRIAKDIGKSISGFWRIWQRLCDRKELIKAGFERDMAGKAHLELIAPNTWRVSIPPASDEEDDPLPK